MAGPGGYEKYTILVQSKTINFRNITRLIPSPFSFLPRVSDAVSPASQYQSRGDALIDGGVEKVGFGMRGVGRSGSRLWGVRIRASSSYLQRVRMLGSTQKRFSRLLLPPLRLNAFPPPLKKHLTQQSLLARRQSDNNVRVERYAERDMRNLKLLN